METLTFPTTAATLGECFGAQVIGCADAVVHSLKALSEASDGSLSFISHKKFEDLLPKLPGGVIFSQAGHVRPDLPLTFIVVPDPQRAFAEVARQFSCHLAWKGISPLAVVPPSVVLGPEVSIAPFVVLGEGTRIGKGTVIHPSVCIGQEVEIGEDCQIDPQVTIRDRVRIGNRVKIFAGSVIGSDGFGFMALGSEADSGRMAVPQIGTVVIEDDVRIGAKCTIDRATLGETWIGKGVKIDNQVHIAHNCRIGAHSVLCAQVGIAGSTTLGEGVVLAGQAGLSNGITLGNGVRIAAQSGVGTDLKTAGDYFGSPVLPMRDALRTMKYFRKLPEIWRRLKALEERFGGSEV